jgi:TM2 domain-containing membrane protein YozV
MELSPAMIMQVQQLPDHKKQMFLTQFSSTQKQISTGYLLWLISCHYFYVGKAGLNIVYWFTFGGLGVWMIIDLFRMKSIIHEANDDTAQRIVGTL